MEHLKVYHRKPHPEDEANGCARLPRSARATHTHPLEQRGEVARLRLTRRESVVSALRHVADAISPTGHPARKDHAQQGRSPSPSKVRSNRAAALRAAQPLPSVRRAAELHRAAQHTPPTETALLEMSSAGVGSP